MDKEQIKKIEEKLLAISNEIEKEKGVGIIFAIATNEPCEGEEGKKGLEKINMIANIKGSPSLLFAMLEKIVIQLS